MFYKLYNMNSNTNRNIKRFLLCPIPNDQKPINEYIELKENQFFNWPLLSNTFYTSKVLTLNFFCFVVTSLTSFNFQLTTFKNWLLININISLFIFFVFLLVNLIQWKNIANKFLQARIFYEESSWFDSQLWDKPFFLIKNDKLIYHQKIAPILRQLQQTIVLVVLFIFLTINLLRII